MAAKVAAQYFLIVDVRLPYRYLYVTNLPETAMALQCSAIIYFNNVILLLIIRHRS